MNRNYGKHFCWTLLLAAVAFSGSALAQVFVVPGGAGSEDGTSWANAYGSIQDALDDSRAADDDVWVAAGTYSVRNILWPTSVSGYGGFAGSESSVGQRDLDANETILDAEGESRIVLVAGGANNVRIDGFTFTRAINDGGEPWWGGFAGSALSFDDSQGTNTVINCRFVNNGVGNAGGNGNIFLQTSSPLIENCVFDGNTTGGIAGAILVNDGSRPTIRNSTFTNNSGGWGALSVRGMSGGEGGQSSHPIIENCLFEDNTGANGGAMSIREGDPAASATIINTHFLNNQSSGHGGAIYMHSNGSLDIQRSYFEGNSADSHGDAIVTNTASTIDITNSVFYNNSSDSGISSVFFAWAAASVTNINYCTIAGNHGREHVLRADGPPVLNVSNSIVWGNSPGGITRTTVTNSITEGGIAEGIDEDPLFRDLDNGDLRLLKDSPAIGIGTNWPSVDFLGESRPQGAAADVGAYEYAPLSVSISGPDTVSVGQNVTLVLNHNAVGDATIVWSKDGDVIDGEEFETLPLGEVDEDDSGVYSVTVEAENGEDTASFTLNVVMGLPVSSPLALALVILALAVGGLTLLSRRTA